MSTNTTTKQTLKIYLRYFWRAPWRRVFLLLLVTFSVACGSIAYPYYLSQIFSRLADSASGTNDRDVLMGLFFTAIAFKSSEYLSWRLFGPIYVIKQAKTLRDLEQMVFKKLLQHDNRFFTNNFGGSLVTQSNRFVRGYEALEDVFTFDILTTVLRIIFVLSVLITQLPLIGLSFLAWIILFVTSVMFLAYKKIPVTKRAAAEDSKVTGVLADSITNIFTTISFASHKQEQRLFTNASEKRYIKRRRSWIWDEWIRAYQSTTMVAFEFIFVWLAIWSVTSGRTDASLVLLAQFYIARIFADLWNLQGIVRRTEQAIGDAAEMTDILHQAPDVQDPLDPIPFTASRGDIVFDTVGYAYPEQPNEPLFSTFNLHIKPGEKIGLIGRSGGGKTTLTKLLLRLMDIDGGSIQIDSQDIARITQEDLRRSIAYVPQEPLMFHRSIRDNIRYGNLEASDREVEAVAKMAHAHTFILDLPNGYDTMVGERGTKLSGGQRQRIAIARAMLKNAPILLLDEATSALDSESEQLIQDALWKLMEGRTAIVIAHRLSTIQKMDRILVLDKGAIVEQGTHKELIHQKGVYAELWGRQSGGFIED